ncbi:MAG: hypothetical protein ACOYK6_07290 [Chthoniobacterales bacterium]
MSTSLNRVGKNRDLSSTTTKIEHRGILKTGATTTTEEKVGRNGFAVCGRTLLTFFSTPFVVLYHLPGFLYNAHRIFCNFNTPSSGAALSNIVENQRGTIASEKFDAPVFLEVGRALTSSKSKVLFSRERIIDATSSPETLNHESFAAIAKSYEPLCAVLEKRKQYLPPAVRAHTKDFQEMVRTFRAIDKYGTPFGKKISQEQFTTFDEKRVSLETAIKDTASSDEAIEFIQTIEPAYKKLTQNLNLGNADLMNAYQEFFECVGKCENMVRQIVCNKEEFVAIGKDPLKLSSKATIGDLIKRLEKNRVSLTVFLQPQDEPEYTSENVFSTLRSQARELVRECELHLRPVQQSG